MAGYSGTPLAKKLGVREGANLLLVNSPQEMEQWLAPLPDRVQVKVLPDRGKARDQDVIVFFPKDEKELTRRFGALARGLRPSGGLWVAWPKKASGVPTDLSDSVVRESGLSAGLVDNKVCAISEVWSGLRFVQRLKDRK